MVPPQLFWINNLDNKSLPGNDADMVQPDENFLENARMLTQVIEGKHSPGFPSERGRLEKLLRNKFAAAFGLSLDKGRASCRFFDGFINTELAPKGRVFDHRTYFRRLENLVIVGQPYGLDEGELRKWSEESGASCTIAPEWGYYYPGCASLFFVEFTPSAKKRFEGRLRASRRARGIIV